MDNKIRNIYITTNVSCNLNCIYCYENKTSKETFDVEKTKIKLKELLSTKTEGNTIVNLHGGEPFLMFVKIKELCEWLWQQEFPEKIIVFATTNGTLVHNKIQKWLTKNKHRFIAGLSLDGTRDMHNINRSNSFDSIDIDFFAKTWPHQGVKMTISPFTIDRLADGIKFLHSKGIHNILVNLAYMVDWSDVKFLKIYQLELQKLSAFYKEHPELTKDSIFDLHFPVLLDKESKKRKRCGAGTEMKAYDIDGREYPCHLFFESVCGKEKSENAKNIKFDDPNEYISRECFDCIFLPTCPTCYGANYIERDYIGNRDMSLCKLEKIRVYEIAKYEYDRIINDQTNIYNLSDDEKIKRIKTLEAIEKLIPEFEKMNEIRL
ncbi:MAG: 4Fe-4S cluster-binding domain-containing protein [Prevotellaceae bacterium]|jgi:radical SAM protein with 4Fe4S-binding SPASM domain|nr:4Fe-4S cluster-binding domain-containing protein [Prevotellaceae bacterium]